MYLLFSILIVIACILLILIVLVQNSKGGGLASNFSSSNQVMGVKKTADFLEKATWSLAIALVVLTLAATFVIPRPDQGVGRASRAQELIPAAQMPTDIQVQQEEPATPVED
ncbi:MAG: preprotein translocase subunit SecG [Candidatus Moranbacteria bacterium]|nr:preprotein translocase subunit SecG [Candidatus Moranbacteria bacterium]